MKNMLDPMEATLAAVDMEMRASRIARATERFINELRGFGLTVSSVEMADHTSAACLGLTLVNSTMARLRGGPVEMIHGPAHPWNPRDRWQATVVGVDFMARP